MNLPSSETKLVSTESKTTYKRRALSKIKNKQIKLITVCSSFRQIDFPLPTINRVVGSQFDYTGTLNEE